MSEAAHGGRIPFTWEPIRNSGIVAGTVIKRAKVPGSWLVIGGPNDSLAYVPDPGWGWDPTVVGKEPLA